MPLKVILARISCFPWLRATYRVISHLPAVGRVSRSAVRYALPLGTRVWARIHSGEGSGMWLKVDPRWHNAYLEGSYEPQLQRLLRAYLRPGDVFYDVGAHIGFFSIIAARLVGDGGKVFSFEAAPENATALEQNISRNVLRQIEVKQVAVWSTCGRMSFRRPYSGALAGAIIEPSPGPPIADDLHIEVPTTTLDCFIEKHAPPTLIKIDVEGAEAEVLEGAGTLFQQHRPALICEVHHQPAATAVCKWLRRNGYAAEWLTAKQDFPRHLLAQPAPATGIPAALAHTCVTG